MKLFNRGNSPDAPSGAVPAPQHAEPVAPAAAPPHAEHAAESDADDKLAAVLDHTVKEITEKLARLSSSVENVREERAHFDEKLVKMEERMRKLTALTEMISSHYNPFLGNEPPAPTSAVAVVQPVAAAHLQAAVAPAERARHAAAFPPAAKVPTDEPDEAPKVESAAGPFLDRVQNSFQNSMTLLQWTEMLLRAAGREHLHDLLDYYKALGWLGDDARDTILTYAKGLQVDAVDRGDWRGRLDLHEKSLVFVEKLRTRGP